VTRLYGEAMNPDALGEELDAEGMLNLVRSSVLEALGERVVGMYLFGSLATGDFAAGVSDIDVLVVTAADLTGSEQTALRELHRHLALRHLVWEDRVEVVYLSVDALATFRTRRSPLSVTSPGEPFHTTTGGRDWLVNWYNVRQAGRLLFGPPAATVIPAITVEEVKEELREQVRRWPARIRTGAAPGWLAYAVLTVARAWDTITNGVVHSKVQSATWASRQLPERAKLLEDAIRVRAAGGRKGGIDAAEAAGFVDEIADRVASGR
jgi:predicted nucleotidyltransferase